MKNNTYLKIGLIAALFSLFCGFDWIDDINKKVTDVLTVKEGGIPPADVSAITESVLSSRKKASALSASKMPFSRIDEEKGKGSVLLALKGEGKDIAKPESTLSVELQLNKETYRSGTAVIAIDGGENIMRVAAAQLYGEAGDKTFEFIYLLSGKDSSTAYLVIISSLYELDGKKYRGYEGTLLYPGTEKWNDWESVYKIDFGYELPLPPEYRTGINGLKEKLGTLRDSLGETKTLKRQISSAQAKAERKAGKPEAEGARKEAEELTAQLEKLSAMNQEELLAFYQLYDQVLEQYTHFQTTNQYTWLSPEKQQSEYALLPDMEQLNKHMESIYEGFLPFLPDAEAVTKVRIDSLAKFEVLKSR